MYIAVIIDTEDSNGFIVAASVGSSESEAIELLRSKCPIDFNTYSEGSGEIDTVRFQKIVEEYTTADTEDTFRLEVQKV